MAPEKYIMVAASPYMGFRMLGLQSGISLLLQATISLAAVAIVWRSFQYAHDSYGVVLLLTTATLLITPYSYIYDTIFLALPAVLLIFRQIKGGETWYERLATLRSHYAARPFARN
jgi:hypothetical protein